MTTKGNVPIQVTPKSVRAGSLADLSKFELSGDQKKLLPYYVTLEYRNTGKETLLPSMDDGVSMLTAAGGVVPPVPLIDLSTAAQGEGIDQTEPQHRQRRQAPAVTAP